jgi:hypothetical protein
MCEIFFGNVKVYYAYLGVTYLIEKLVKFVQDFFGQDIERLFWRCLGTVESFLDFIVSEI